MGVSVLLSWEPGGKFHLRKIPSEESKHGKKSRVMAAHIPLVCSLGDNSPCHNRICSIEWFCQRNKPETTSINHILQVDLGCAPDRSPKRLARLSQLVRVNVHSSIDR